jgi:threonylcarbamoyladenosine tRNA methylthiotransferase MtaB
MNITEPTVAIATLGCKTNQFESAALEEKLKNAGYRLVPFEEGADLVVVNTCTVTAATDAQSRNLVRRARRLNAFCRVVVTGCYAQVNPEGLKSIPGVSLVLGNEEKRNFLRLLEEGEEGADRVRVSDIRQARRADPLPLSVFSERARAFLQIQNGCDAFCAYCLIPYARGPSRSVPPGEVLRQVERLAKGGYPEVVLTGIHIGGYGADLDSPSSLLDLVHLIEGKTAVLRLRLGSLEPTEIPRELVETVAGSKVLCPHFHIPLQAGDDAVLKRMNRHYDTAFFGKLVEGIKERIPHSAVGLDVIAGFPGETDEEFENTFRLVESLPVSHLHVFPFSRRPGTPAAAMAGQLPGNVIRERAARLRTLGERKNREFARTFLGRTLEVVVEGGKAGELRRGLSRNYLSVFFPGEDGLEGCLAEVEVNGWTSEGLRGRLL